MSTNSSTAVSEGSSEGSGEESSAAEQEAAALRLAELVSDEAIDRMLADAQASETPLDGPDGLINQITRKVIERALGAELDEHLGYVKGDPAGNGSGNSRNGSFGKTVTTSSGPVRIAVPRDRNGSFEPKIVRKGQRRLTQIDDMIFVVVCAGNDHPGH